MVAGSSALDDKEAPDKEQILRDHSLIWMLPWVKRIFREVGWRWNWKEAPTPRELEQLIAELEAVDGGSYAFRCPVDREGQGSVPHHFGFYVPDFAARMDAALSMLDGACTGLEVYYDEMMELIVATDRTDG